MFRKIRRISSLRVSFSWQASNGHDASMVPRKRVQRRAMLKGLIS